jgi:uridine phosphorylase
MPLAASELILNNDGSIYHLHLHPEQIADSIITVGDPDRVPMVSKYFDKIEHKIHKREFVTHSGLIGGKKISVISTGIGTDNIDIVLNELDALVNIDLENRVIKKDLKSLNFIRIGTSGCLRPEIPVDSFLVSDYAIGLDGLLNFYKNEYSHKEISLLTSIQKSFYDAQINLGIQTQVASGSELLLDYFRHSEFFHGITVTATGFYAPQSRQLRAEAVAQNLFSVFEKVEFEDLKITNLEMETAGIYGLSKILGHHAISLSALVANRARGSFSANPEKTVETLIYKTLEIVSDKILNS